MNNPEYKEELSTVEIDNFDVDTYIKDNGISQKLKITQKEVYNNQENANELRDKAQQCGIPINALGVPLLWNGEDCLIGDQSIIDFLNEQIQ